MKLLSAYVGRKCLDGRCTVPELLIITNDINVLVVSFDNILYMYQFITISDVEILDLTCYLGSSKVSHILGYMDLIDLFIQIEDMYGISIEEFSFGHISYEN